MALVLPISGAETRSTIYTAFSVGVTIVYIYIYIRCTYRRERRRIGGHLMGHRVRSSCTRIRTYVRTRLRSTFTKENTGLLAPVPRSRGASLDPVVAQLRSSAFRAGSL